MCVRDLCVCERVACDKVVCGRVIYECKRCTAGARIIERSQEYKSTVK